MKHFLRIPRDRIGSMIGPGGRVKKELERRTGVRVEVDSESGEVTLDYEGARDPALVLKVDDFVRAVGRGFSPQRAMKLLRDEYFLQIIDIQEYVGKSPSHVRRMRARVIGTGGKTRRVIEELSGAELSIYGDTVSVIGDPGSLDIARTALDMLLSGSEHSAVYSYLEHSRRERRLAELAPPEPREEE